MSRATSVKLQLGLASLATFEVDAHGYLNGFYGNDVGQNITKILEFKSDSHNNKRISKFKIL